MLQYTLPRAKTAKHDYIRAYEYEYDYLQSVEGESHEKAVDLLKAAQSKFENLFCCGGNACCLLIVFGFQQNSYFAINIVAT